MLKVCLTFKVLGQPMRWFVCTLVCVCVFVCVHACRFICICVCVHGVWFVPQALEKALALTAVPVWNNEV